MRPFALPLLLMLTACAAGAPAPVVYGRGQTPAQVEPVRARAPRAPAPVEIRTPRPHPQTPAPNWAAGPGTPLSTWALRPEEAAPFDPAAWPRTHTVVAGETLYALSVRYQAPLRALIEANNIAAPFTLRVGQALTLPPPRMHRVRTGETLSSVARRYNIDARSLALLNRMPAPYTVRAGDQLVLPALARGQVQDAPTESPTPEVRPAGPVRFAWPLTGRILTRFGPQPGGRRSDGVDIATAAGNDVKAAGDGEVVYAGEDLPGYGALMLVQHPGGWITAYANCASFAVKEGDRVRTGQKIAAAGVGKVHFQVRKAGAPVDPLSTLPPA